MNEICPNVHHFPFRSFPLLLLLFYGPLPLAPLLWAHSFGVNKITFLSDSLLHHTSLNPAGNCFTLIMAMMDTDEKVVLIFRTRYINIL